MERDDRVLSGNEVETLLASPVVVEEKLDGANVMVWLDAMDAIRVGSRGGAGAIDRAGQLGPLRAWAARNADSMRQLLDSNVVLYGEWLWFTHAVRYERLPGPFVGLDLRSGDGRFVDVPERDRAFRRFGIVPPPTLYEGVLGSMQRLVALLGASRFGDALAEGLVVRRLEPREEEVRLAKLVAPTFRRRDDEDWRGRLARNRLLTG